MGPRSLVSVVGVLAVLLGFVVGQMRMPDETGRDRAGSRPPSVDLPSRCCSPRTPPG